MSCPWPRRSARAPGRLISRSCELDENSSIDPPMQILDKAGLRQPRAQSGRRDDKPQLPHLILCSKSGSSDLTTARLRAASQKTLVIGRFPRSRAASFSNPALHFPPYLADIVISWGAPASDSGTGEVEACFRAL